ncbi:YoaK family protein [Paraglaciecola mesophila]|uniref:YoaK family protein n=1 Tax=Paraglaciecola mesophila TaxID=197222 RepID=A0ABU9SQF0_9ALTE|tara:strand:+ start:8553 stop:9221 length:669 start_codon:yes stop_codon:yes gene_type:complete
MISRLPRWVEYGAFILAMIAGTVNAVGLLGFTHQAISHLSGTATLIGASLSHVSLKESFHLFAILLSFMLGAAFSGFFLRNRTLKLSRHYDFLLFTEGCLLLLSIWLLRENYAAGHYTASAACGLQNALATTYSGAIIRTTHMTGIFTDLGIMLGERLRQKSFDKRKMILFLLLISGFISGGVIGTSLFTYFGFNALLVPASLCFVLALSYRVYRNKMKRRR